MSEIVTATSQPGSVGMTECSSRLRFVQRDGKRILQQLWFDRVFDANLTCISSKDEWRDVPLEEEATQ